jgi:hypothetical protein
LPLDGHGDLIIADPVKIPVMMGGNVLNDVYGVDVVFQMMLG